ncbi:MAG TPA: hypothetical protein VGU68_16530 [Ktedonobacteraceae bacterium]|nr:hypothetical protein [Ktedonobacteraceae bacterium]
MIYAKHHTPLVMLVVALGLALVLAGCQSNNATASSFTPLSKASVTQTTQMTQLTAHMSSLTGSGGWNSFMLGFHSASNQAQAGVVNVDYASSKTELLTQYVLLNPQYDGIASDGKDLLYQQSLNGYTQYYTVLSARPKTGFFYEQRATGNAIWLPDSRHALVLDQDRGITQVNVQTGQTQKVLSLPFGDATGAYLDRIEALKFYHNGYLYFSGSGGGECLGALCRIQLNVSHPTLDHITGRQSGTTYWLSPDGGTIYYRNMGPAGEPGIYAVNSDGTNLRNLRPTNDATYNTGIPIGFAADNSLVIMRNVKGKFQIVQLGATPRQDRILQANAAPGAASLCDPSYKGSGITICDKYIALAPYSHAIVVQSTLANGMRQLRVTNLITGQQQLLHPRYLPAGAPVQLPGWDQLPVCAGNRC